MALQVIDIYKGILPKTNCKECGHPTCLAFASAVVLEQYSIDKCPHLDPEVLKESQAILEAQYRAGKFLKKDLAQDALEWARERSSSMKLEDLTERIGGRLLSNDGEPYVELPYFSWKIKIKKDALTDEGDKLLDRWEQVFIYNHMAQGGDSLPSGKWIAFEEIPNTVSKVKTMRDKVEAVLSNHFRGRQEALKNRSLTLGAKSLEGEGQSADLVLEFWPLPRIPLRLFFWDAEEGEEFEARTKLLFDRNILEHLDIESILFLSERLTRLLCQEL